MLYKAKKKTRHRAPQHRRCHRPRGPERRTSHPRPSARPHQRFPSSLRLPPSQQPPHLRPSARSRPRRRAEPLTWPNTAAAIAPVGPSAHHLPQDASACFTNDPCRHHHRQTAKPPELPLPVPTARTCRLHRKSPSTKHQTTKLSSHQDTKAASNQKLCACDKVPMIPGAITTAKLPSRPSFYCQCHLHAPAP